MHFVLPPPYHPVAPHRIPNADAQEKQKTMVLRLIDYNTTVGVQEAKKIRVRNISLTRDRWSRLNFNLTLTSSLSREGDHSGTHSDCVRVHTEV